MAYRESGKCDPRELASDESFTKLCGCCKLNAFDWLANIPKTTEYDDIAEVRFKNTRKGFFRNVNRIRINKGDIVAVEASPGHDIGIV